MTTIGCGKTFKPFLAMPSLLMASPPPHLVSGSPPSTSPSETQCPPSCSPLPSVPPRATSVLTVTLFSKTRKCVFLTRAVAVPCATSPAPGPHASTKPSEMTTSRYTSASTRGSGPTTAPTATIGATRRASSMATLQRNIQRS